MKQLEQLPEMTAEMLGGLHAAQDLKDEILRDGALARKDGKKHYRNSPWAAVAPEKRRATHAGRVLATVCSFAFIIGLLVGIPLMIANALNDKPLPVYGTGENVRDWLYVEDHCKAIDMILHNGRVGEVYNIGGHNEMRNIDIVKIICKALGKPESLITYVTDRKGHDMRYAIDPTKIHRELGWLPETKFADGIQKTIRWYLDNRAWWETIISGEYRDYYEKMYGNR